MSMDLGVDVSVKRRPGAARMATWLLAGSILASATGCLVGPDYEPPLTPMPDYWHQDATAGLAEGQADIETWWEVFEDPILLGLIERAHRGNYQLAEAYWSVRQGRALRGIAEGELYPTVGGNASWSRSRKSPNTSPTAKRRLSYGESVLENFAIFTGASLIGPLALGIPRSSKLESAKDKDLYSVGFDSSWEIDVFGGIRRNIESSDAFMQGDIENYRDVLVSLFAEVAVNYVEVRTLQARLRYARSNVETQKDSLSLVTERRDAGLAPELDVAQAESNLANTESDIPTLEQLLAQTIHRLGVLIGETPNALYPELMEDQPIPLPPQEVAVGLPVDLLRRRPDIRRAERDLAAFTAQIGVATSDLYPRFSLSGTFALESSNFSGLGNFNNRAWSFGPAMRWNIFDGLRNVLRVRAAEALTEEIWARYERTVLVGLQDVEDAMVAFLKEQERRDALMRAVDATGRAVSLVEELYRTGLTDFQNVLDTQRSLFLQQDSLAVSEGLVTQNLITLYKALGGGWGMEGWEYGETLEEGRLDERQAQPAVEEPPSADDAMPPEDPA